MEACREESSVLTGNLMHFSEHHAVAIYKRDGICWVAEFHGGCGSLTDAASWFRADLGALRYSHSRRAAVLETMTAIPPEMVDRIEALHRPTHPRVSGAAFSPAGTAAAVRRWYSEMASRSAARATS